MYVIYCQNKPVSEHIVAEHLDYFDKIRQKLRHKLLVSAQRGVLAYGIDDFELTPLFCTQICDLLIKPVQRFMKYEMMLRDILRQTERAGLVQEMPYLQEAIKVMRVSVRTAKSVALNRNPLEVRSTFRTDCK